jgi:putative phosphoribosyl transferase
MNGAVILGMPRGGVPVARVVADELGAPLDVIVARKLGVPGLDEVSLGAIAEGWSGVVEDSVRWFIGVPRDVVATIVKRERVEVQRRVYAYRGGQPLPDVRGQTVVVVDDGLASGATMRAAARALRTHRPARVIAAVPVASPDHCADVAAEVDEFVVLATPDPFEMVSTWYDAFSAVDDQRVVTLLGRSAAPIGEAVATPEEREVVIPIRARGGMVADVGTPNDGSTRPRGLVILAHGGGSSRMSYRNRYLAGRLRTAGWATLRVDLMTEVERDVDDATADLRFDVDLISTRLQTATEWAASTGAPGAGRIVLFGASTGAAAAIRTAAARPDLVAGVASRGGRVDLAGDALASVRVPVLMIVGGADGPTLQHNREAAGRLRTRYRLTVVQGAGHTFEEPGALGAVGEKVVSWASGLGTRHSALGGRFGLGRLVAR